MSMDPMFLSNSELEEMGEVAPVFDEEDQREFEAEKARAAEPFWK